MQINLLLHMILNKEPTSVFWACLFSLISFSFFSLTGYWLFLWVRNNTNLQIERNYQDQDQRGKKKAQNMCPSFLTFVSRVCYRKGGGVWSGRWQRREKGLQLSLLFCWPGHQSIIWLKTVMESRELFFSLLLQGDAYRRWSICSYF